MDPDDTLDEKRTNSKGEFSLNGFTMEMATIDPVLYVWHDCLDEMNPCLRKIKLEIPKKFIHDGNPDSSNWVDIGTINLEGSFASEKRECVN